MKHVRSSCISLVVLLASLCLFGFCASAQAQVSFEGKASFKILWRGAQMQSSAHVDRVSNYTYTDYPNARVVLVLSKKAYKPRSAVRGYTIAATNPGFLPARTYVDNVNLSGATRTVKGKFRVLLLVVDGNNQILTGATFKKQAKIGLTAALSAAEDGGVSAKEEISQ
jgi:hypothetical protein